MKKVHLAEGGASRTGWVREVKGKGKKIVRMEEIDGNGTFDKIR